MSKNKVSSRPAATGKHFFSIVFLILFAVVFSSTRVCRAGSGWFVSAYWAQATESRLVEIAGKNKFIDSNLVALAVSKELWSHRKKLSVEGEFQVVKHFGKEFTCETEECEKYRDRIPVKYSDKQNHEEFNVVIIFRWHELPWDEYLDTSVAVGEGFSYATQVPPIEKDYHDLSFGGDDRTSKMLNYLLLEISTAVPKLPDWSVFVRVHHRSGIFGLFNGVNGGSNFVGTGIRYNF